MFLVNQSFVGMISASPSSSPPSQFSVKMDSASISSSPPTPPSPLPISVGPGHQKYCFSSSPSPSPPFSPHSSHTSPENTPLLSTESIEQPKQPSAFSLDKEAPDESEAPSSRFEACLEWLFLRCCCCRSWFRELIHTHKEKEETHFHL